MWDLTLLTISFHVKGKHILLHGQQLLYESYLHLLQDSEKCELKKLLVEFNDLFQELVGLPPLHSYDHRICLLLGTNSVIVQLYRYPHFQKDEIKKL